MTIVVVVQYSVFSTEHVTVLVFQYDLLHESKFHATNPFIFINMLSVFNIFVLNQRI